MDGDRPAPSTRTNAGRERVETDEAAWALQHEFMRWRRDLGFDPPADVLNRFARLVDEAGALLPAAVPAAGPTPAERDALLA